ncbi:MAG: ABC transporter ATP-binding protein, partial [Chloroflexi bacterium]|nr:ABC transporter ATP-binding protein [Chloroflexota bacterium]
SLRIQPGKITGIIGPNGAGKSTLFNLITGLHRPDSGDIYLKGQRITGLAPHRIVRLGIGRTFQDLRLFNRLSVLDNVLVARQEQLSEHVLQLFARWRTADSQERAHRRRATESLDFVGLAHKADDLAENLSYGQQKRLAIARLLAMEPDLLMLDEPAAGLDPEAVGVMCQLICSLVAAGKTVCLVEHNLDVVREICDWAICLDQGALLVEGPPGEALRDPRLVEAYLGV